MPRKPRVRVNSQFRPRVATSGRDCGVATTEELIRHGTDGALILTPGEVRDAMGNQTGWTTPLDSRKAVMAMAAKARKLGLKPPKYKLAGNVTSSGLFTSGASKQSLIRRAQAGELIQLVISYSRVNQRYPALSGSRTFMGRHSVWCGGFADFKGGLGIRKRNGRWELRYADPTWNRPGTPRGPKWVPLSTIWAISNGAWSSRGGTGWVGGSTPSALYLPVALPAPKPDDCRPIKEELEEAQGALADAQALVETLRAKRVPRALADQLNDIAQQIDSLVPAVQGVDDTQIIDGMEVSE
jgi:hypothetical protein